MNQQNNNNINHNTLSPTFHKSFKINGFSPPFPWQQIITWLLFILHAIIFSVITMPLLNRVLSSHRQLMWMFSSFFIILSLIVIALSLISTYIDPSDLLLKQELLKREKYIKQNEKFTLQFSKKDLICIICCCNINNDSKHCKKCNKCIEHFDHHCNWLNNCIGKLNYSYFYLLLLILIINFILNIVICALSLFSKENKHKSKYDSIITAILGLAYIIGLINIGYLFIIHTWLRIKGITTYEYICLKEQEQERNSNSNININNNNNNSSNFNRSDVNNKNKEKQNKSENNPLNHQIDVDHNNDNPNLSTILKKNSTMNDSEKKEQNSNKNNYNIINHSGNTDRALRDNYMKKQFPNKCKNKMTPSEVIERFEENNKKTCCTASYSVNNQHIPNLFSDKGQNCFYRIDAEKIIIEADNIQENIFQSIIDQIYSNQNKQSNNNTNNNNYSNNRENDKHDTSNHALEEN